MKDSREQRRKDLAMIHIGKKELRLDDDLYRCFVKQVCGVESSAELDAPSRRMLLAAMRGKGAFRKSDHTQNRPKNMNLTDRNRIFKKIEAELTNIQQPWSYADSIAKQMFGIDRLAFCKPHQLNKVMLALIYNRNRKDKAKNA